jgi:hypothetical protein
LLLLLLLLLMLRILLLRSPELHVLVCAMLLLNAL